MARPASSGDEEDVALALKISQLSSNDIDDAQVAQLPREGPAPANLIPRSPLPIRDEKDDSTLASRLSLPPPLLPSDDSDEQLAPMGSASASEKAHSSTPSNESDEDDVEPVMILIQPQTDTSDERARAPNQRMQGALSSLPAPGLSDHTSGSDDYSQAVTLAKQGTCLVERYENSGVLAELEEGINSLTIANQLIPEDHPMKPPCLSSLGNSFHSRFERLGGIDDIGEAIALQQQAVRLTPDDRPYKPSRLTNLGISLRCRFDRLGNIADLDQAITAHQQAVRLTPESDPRKPACLNNLGNGFLSRFERLGNIVDVSEAIVVQQLAVRLTTDGQPHKPACLNSLGMSLRRRFERLGDIADLDEAILAQQQAVRLTTDGHPQKPRRLGNLGVSLRHRFERLGDIADLDKAITAQQYAVLLTPDSHPSKPAYLNFLGSSLLRQFERLGDVASLVKAIKAQQQAVHLTPDGHPDKPGRLGNLGNSFQRQFERLGDIADIDKAIMFMQQAAHLTPDGHPEKPVSLSNLGISLRRRFDRFGEIADLDKTITIQQQALRLTSDGHPHKPGCFHDLGTSFRYRFNRLGDVTDLDKAITAHQQALQLTPDGHPREPGHLSGLGTSLSRRFEHLGDIADLEKAILAQQRATRLTPDGHHEKPGRLANLGNSLLRRFGHSGGITDLDEAIVAHQQAVHLTPDGHHDKPAILNNLGQSYRARLSHHHDDATFAQAIRTYSQSARLSSGPPPHRFTAAREWATLCFSVQSNETIEAYSTLIDLLPRVVWLGRTVQQRYNDISTIGGAVTNAAAAAIHLGMFDLALEWLEQGRSIVWGQMLQLRTPLDELHRHHPNEANELEKVSRALDSVGVTYSDHLGSSNDDAPQSLDDQAQAHRRLAEEYESVLARIRSLPGFGDFLQPKKAAFLCRAAISGPVVIVTAHESRGDALILLPHSSQVSHVPLPGLEMSVAQEMQIHLTGFTRGVHALQRDYVPYSEVDTSLSGIIGWLWSHIAEPVLSHLELLQKPTSGKMPHITWCLTGPLTFLPIHAAGLYDAKDGPKIFDYVFSSYTPTLSLLLAANRRPPQSNQTARLLTVSQPVTPGLSPLPGTVHELDAIQNLHSPAGPLRITRLQHTEATVAAVLRHMKECSWIHLACHGIQDTANPIESAFHLIDNPLTLKEIMKQSFTHTELAVLSACQTAKGDSKLPEEAIHLAAGMLMAGYRSVVGTMWSIRDDDAPIIAEKFYKYLIDEAGGDSSGAAYALHNAVAHLRDIRGENNFASWVPFIHLGIYSPLPE